MTEPTRRLALTKKVSLASISEGWDKCYAVIRPATRPEFKHMMNPDTFKDLDPDAQVALQDTFVIDHLVAGKVLIGDESKQLDDLQREDVENVRQLSNFLYFEIMGLKYDPKDL